ncbi:AvrD family protein [Streptomyces sp. 4N509B]|uniref:AvrD family protein n=1 Tax=Streptomyces sp. 4N509B TaxID=3457413 RepID=UPI003FD51688
MTVTTVELASRTVDDFLGPGGKRFFATGYRRVEYHFGKVRISVDGEAAARVSTTLTLHYPSDWSKKSARGAIPPHLSTVDAVVVGAQLTELCLTQTFGLTPRQRARTWLAGITIRAGSTPDEALDDVAVTATLLGSTPGGDGLTRSVVETVVGRMRVRCEAVHDSAPARPGTVLLAGPDDLLGPADSRYYGTGFTRGAHRVDDLSVDAAGMLATASVTLRASGATAGIEGAHQPRATPVDCFVTGLQLGQVLLYELDAMGRGTSDTLWMRSTAIELPRPTGHAMVRLPLATRLRRPALVEMRGGVWRTADIVAELGALRFTCNVTHRLPG